MAPDNRLETYRDYARIAAVMFAGVSVYTLIFKLPGGELVDDWMHTLLHVVWGAATAYAGWVARELARTFALATLALYGVLLVVGLFADGLFMEQEFRIPLDAAANVFHLVLFGLGVGFVARAKAR